jgi:hypothetical protein
MAKTILEFPKGNEGFSNHETVKNGAAFSASLPVSDTTVNLNIYRLCQKKIQLSHSSFQEEKKVSQKSL